MRLLPAAPPGKQPAQCGSGWQVQAIPCSLRWTRTPRLRNHMLLLLIGGRAGRLPAFGSAVPGDAVLGAAGQGARRHPAAPLSASGGAAGRADRAGGTPPRAARRQTRPCPHKGETPAIAAFAPECKRPLSLTVSSSAAVQWHVCMLCRFAPGTGFPPRVAWVTYV